MSSSTHALGDAGQAVQVGGGEVGDGPLEQRADALRGIQVRRVCGQPVDPFPGGDWRARGGRSLVLGASGLLILLILLIAEIRDGGNAGSASVADTAMRGKKRRDALSKLECAV